MRWWKTVLLVVLLALPIVAFVIVGAWMLWLNGWLLWLWWLYPLCWGTAYLLVRWRRVGPTDKPPPELTPPKYWTARDEQALAIVAAEQRRVNEIPIERLSEPRFYLEAATELSLKIARHYHPTADDPLSSLTLPEVLAAAHLALEELERWVERYVPASHLLTIRQWRSLSKAPAWYSVARDVSWLASMLWSPVNVGRYLLSRVTMDTTTRRLQANLQAWFYVMFIRHVGFYAIEMNSGRLRGGADRYRAATGQFRDGEEPSRDGRGEIRDGAAREVTIAVVGQVKAGKSSVINSLLGERRAAVDVVPLTSEIQQFRLALPRTGDRLVLLDTPGYGDDGATAEQTDQVREAFQIADLVLLVMRATSPARAADVELVRAMSEWFAEHPRKKPPPVLGVLTHIDGLSPVMQWSPPYNWEKPSSAKENSIGDAVQFNLQQFDTLLAAMAPVCSDQERNRVYGIQEWLVPTVAALLGEARGCAMLRTLHSELDAGRVRKTFDQLRAAGTRVMQACLWGPAADAASPRRRG